MKYNLTHAPLPDWELLIPKYSKYKKININEIIHPWKQPKDNILLFSRSAWALLAIADLKMKITKKDKLNIWFPAYFCNESTRLIRNINSKLSFYPVLEDGSPNFEYCQKMLEKNSPDIFILTHYFGKITKQEESINFSKINNSWLVEDCAHVLIPNKESNFNGDFIFYSPHKFLPIPDGSILIINTNGPNNLKANTIKGYNSQDLKKYSIPNIDSLFTSYKWLTKRIIQKFGFNFGFIKPKPSTRQTLTNKRVISPKMSFLSKYLLSEINKKLDQELHERNTKQNIWFKEMKTLKLNKKYDFKFIQNKNPYLAIIDFKNLRKMSIFYNKLLKFKLPVTKWPDLPPEVLNNPNRQAMAIQLYKNRIFFPVHRSILKKSIISSLKILSL